MLSLILTACGGTETKSSENEQKATTAAANSNAVNLQNQPTPKVDADQKDADDLPAGKTPGNSNVTNSKSPKPTKKDPDDINKKGDADDKNRKSSADKDDDDDDK